MRRIAHRFFIVIFLLLLFSVPVITLLMPRSHTSYYEQRTLASVPKITWEGLLSGEFFTGVEAALSDHIVLRDQIVRLSTSFDLVLERPVVNDIIIGSDVLLRFNGYSSWDLSYLTELSEQVGAQLQTLDEQIRAYGGCFYYLGVPLQSSYFASHYPAYMDNREWHVSEIRRAFSESMKAHGISFIDMHLAYESLGFPAGYYYATDHHYTYEGAFAAYTTLMNQINSETGKGLMVLTESDLEFITMENTYLGSSNRKLYGLWKNEDQLVAGVLKEPIPFTRMDNGVPVEDALYVLPENKQETVTYNAYMGGDVAETIIETNRPTLPNVLVFGDSFTNPLETLIWASFNETHYLDLRYYTEESLEHYIAEYQPDIVICVRDESVYLSQEGNGKLS